MNSNPALRLSRPAPVGAQAGFTLVELVTVILVLGVLAAVALPRYADLQSQARAAKVQGMFGAMKAASGLVKASATANNVNCSAETVAAGVTLEGVAIDLNFCYAQALSSPTAGILAAANLPATPADDNWVVVGGGSAKNSTVTITLTGAATPASCAVAYTSPAASAPAANSSPTITSTVSGC